MKTSDVIKHYGSQVAVANAIGLTKQAISQWGELVPPLSAARIERDTNGVLTFDPDDYEGRYKPNAA